MPTVVTSNTAAPTVMIAERGAEFILTRHQLFKNQNGSGLNNRAGAGNGDGYGHTQWNKEHDHKWDERWKPWDKNWHGNLDKDSSQDLWFVKNNVKHASAPSR